MASDEAEEYPSQVEEENTEQETEQETERVLLRRKVFHKAIVDFFLESYVEIISTAETDKLRARVRDTTRHQMEAVKAVSVLNYIQALPLSTIDDDFVRRWALNNSAGFAMSLQPGMSVEEVMDAVTTYDLLCGVLKYIGWVLDETQLLMGHLGMEEKDSDLVFRGLEAMYEKLEKRFELPRP